MTRTRKRSRNSAFDHFLAIFCGLTFGAAACLFTLNQMDAIWL
jgi:hypothetical protein